MDESRLFGELKYVGLGIFVFLKNLIFLKKCNKNFGHFFEKPMFPAEIDPSYEDKKCVPCHHKFKSVVFGIIVFLKNFEISRQKFFFPFSSPHWQIEGSFGLNQDTIWFVMASCFYHVIIVFLTDVSKFDFLAPKRTKNSQKTP